MTDENAFEVIDELKRINLHLAQIGEALEWFNLLQRDRHQAEHNNA